MKPSTEFKIGRLRGMVPRPLLPAFVKARTKLAWSQAKVREDAREQMRFVLEHTDPGADIETAARRYVERQVWRGELRWHIDIVTDQQVEGLEHLIAARDLGRGVVLSHMHHGQFEGGMASIVRRGVVVHAMGDPRLLEADAPAWMQQHAKVALATGAIPVVVSAGSDAMVKILQDGGIMTIASDVPGRTPMRFLGRDLVGSFGAVRLAMATGAPVVVMTSELRDGYLPVVRLHEPFDPAQFPSAQKLLEAILAAHEPYIVRWPEMYDIPTSHWGIPDQGPDNASST
jgi:lauroyl/myristoyl acyltransferase